MFGGDRNELRQMYRNAWQKHTSGAPLTALEALIADVVAQHPEYHATVASGDLDRDYLPDGGQTNPFLHMGLHLGLREQIATDRPPGIRAVWNDLTQRRGDAHAAEHEMIECLAETLWEAQNSNTAPDESRYLERLKTL